MTHLFYSDMCKSCKSVTMRFIFTQIVNVKLTRFTLTHTIVNLMFIGPCIVVIAEE